MMGLFVSKANKTLQVYFKRGMNNKVAEYTNKLITFREEIRRSQIEQIFMQKRKSMQFTFQRGHQSKVFTQLTSLYQDLVEARQQQGYEDFIQNKRLYFPEEWLYQFINRDVSYQLQYKATSILAEYYSISSVSTPSQLNLKCLTDCFNQSQNEILLNSIFILDKILDDCREVKEILIQKLNFVELISQKIEKYRNNKNILQKILQMLYRLLNLSEYYSSYSQLLYPLGSFILSLEDQSTPFTKKINLTAIFNFHLLIKIYPQIDQLSKEIVQAKVINKLIRLLYKPEYANNRLFFVVFDLISICRLSLKQEDIKQQIMPLITELRKINFLNRHKSCIYTNQAIKIKSYSYLLYLTQNQFDVAQNLFLDSNFLMLRSLLQQLSFELNPTIAELLAKILFCLSFSIKEQSRLVEEITSQIKRTLYLNNNRYDLQIYFEDQNSRTPKQL